MIFYKGIFFSLPEIYFILFIIITFTLNMFFQYQYNRNFFIKQIFFFIMGRYLLKKK